MMQLGNGRQGCALLWASGPLSFGWATYMFSEALQHFIGTLKKRGQVPYQAWR